MASTRRRPNSSLKSDIFERPQAYDFFQAVRIIEAMAAEEAAAAGASRPDAAGRGVDPKNASISIHAAVPLGFAAAEVNAIRRPRGGGPVEMTQTVVGLTGPSGVLPHAFSEMVQISVRERNPGLREFFDLFNNRLAGLLYDAWAKYRIAVESERADRLATARPIDAALRALVGIGMPALTGRTESPDATFVYFGGLLGRQGRSSTAIEQVLCGMLGFAVRVEQFHGEWLPIDATDRSRLPGGDQPDGAYCQLGEDTVIGESTFDIQSSVILHVEPLHYPVFRSLLPDGAQARKFADLAAMAIGPDKTYRIRLGLRPEEIPALQLTGDRDVPEASRLGWNTWLNSTLPRSEPVQAEFRPVPHLR
jgi:type VI secretion system protein ImpH